MTTIHLVRHATAGRRTAGSHDIERPLDENGRAQADSLARRLGTCDATAVLSSPAARCVETVAPLADKLGVDVEESDALWEGQGARPALGLVHRLAASDSSAVLCSHGDVIPHLLDLLSAEGVILHGYGCAKGSVWSLRVADGRISSAEYVPAP